MNLRASLQLMRISNLPTVWSNVVHGLTAGLFVALVLPVEKIYDTSPPLDTELFGRLLNQGFMLFVGLSLLYVGGMVLNDVCDAKIDAAERPQRPIPSGAASRRAALTLAVLLLALGWACTLVYPPTIWLCSAVLAGAIVAYNLLHRFRALGLLLMASCRGLVVWIAAAMLISTQADVQIELWRAGLSVLAIACYTALITLIAWSEALPSFPKLAKYVGWMIAAMPVIDAVFVGLYGFGPAVVFCLVCAGLTVIGQRFVAGS